MPDSTIHVPVLLNECLQALQVAPGMTLVDGTLGGGGHARALAEGVGASGLVLAVDRDPQALVIAEPTLRGLPIKIAHSSYVDIPELLEQLQIEAVDGILLDLGLSSDQLADQQRGFSFHSTGPLDLRFDPTRGEPAWKLIERLSPEHLADLIFQFGEERYSRRIARKIVEQRRQDPVRTAQQLAELVRKCVPRSPRDSIDPATRTFQALRIAVNEELRQVELALKRLPDCLKVGGRLAIISFHSLEDRRVKQHFTADPRLNVISKRPLTASDAEVDRNPRARSAKLRVAERIA